MVIKQANPYTRHRQSCTQCGLMMTSHNATRNANDNIKMDRLAASAADLLQSTVSLCRFMFHLWVPFWTFEHNNHLTLSSCAQQKYFSSHDSWNVRFLACFDRDIFRSKYARRVRPWSFSMHCRWWHWGRGMHLLPLQRHTRETSLSTWLPMPALHHRGGRAQMIVSLWYPGQNVTYIFLSVLILLSEDRGNASIRKITTPEIEIGYPGL